MKYRFLGEISEGQHLNPKQPKMVVETSANEAATRTSRVDRMIDHMEF